MKDGRIKVGLNENNNIKHEIYRKGIYDKLDYNQHASIRKRTNQVG